MANPFIRSPKIVTGEGFIGRKDLIKSYTKLYLTDEQCGNLSLCGLPRIGKSSLIHNLLHCNKEPIADNIIIAETNLGMHKDFNALWIDITGKLKTALEEKRLFDDRIKYDMLSFEKRDMDYIELVEALDTLFIDLSDKGIKTLIYIDEFDYVSRVFGESEDAATYFQCMRSFCSEQKYNVSYIIVSRRSLEYLECRACGGSVFYLTFDSRQLQGFNDNELEEYKQILQRHGCEVTEELWEDIMFRAGRSPFLLSTMGKSILNMLPESNINKVYEECSQQYLNYFKEIVKLLKEENYFQNMLKVCIGPKFDLKPAEVTEMENRGYISKKESDWETVCDYFTSYLMDIWEIEGKNQIWPLLMETENRLRSIILQGLTKKYGDAWETEIEAEYLNRITIDKDRFWDFVDFKKAKRYISNNTIRYGSKVSSNMLSVISIHELSNILELYWDECFRKSFNNTEFEEWVDKLEKLYIARNPLAHGNAEYLSTNDISICNVYCEEILMKTKNFREAVAV